MEVLGGWLDRFLHIQIIQNRLAGVCTESGLFDALGIVVLPCHYVQKSFEMLFKGALAVLGVGNHHFDWKYDKVPFL